MCPWLTLVGFALAISETPRDKSRGVKIAIYIFDTPPLFLPRQKGGDYIYIYIDLFLFIFMFIFKFIFMLFGLREGPLKNVYIYNI